MLVLGISVQGSFGAFGAAACREDSLGRVDRGLIDCEKRWLKRGSINGRSRVFVEHLFTVYL